MAQPARVVHRIPIVQLAVGRTIARIVVVVAPRPRAACARLTPLRAVCDVGDTASITVFAHLQIALRLALRAYLYPEVNVSIHIRHRWSALTRISKCQDRRSCKKL